jgi:DNA polymerase III delta prime subunit
LASLYSLLEEDTATMFEDQALPGISINASFVRFILLGNEATIPEPILSRVLTFQIEPLTSCQLRKVSRSIFEDEVDKLGIVFDANLPESVLDQAQGLSLRQCKIRFQSAIGIAIANRKREIDINSWECSNNSIISNRKIGFI